MDTRHPNDLRVHPLLASLPQWADGDPRLYRLREDVRAHGILEPALITPGNEIIDGRHRWRVARRLEIEVPVRVVPADLAVELAISTLTQRSHYTPGQRAYIVEPLAKEAFAAARERKLAGVKADLRNSVPKVPETPEKWAEKIGVSVQYLREAHKVHALFAAHAETKWNWSDAAVLASLGKFKDARLTFREYFEPQILAEEKPIGLGAAVAGMVARLRQARAERRGQKYSGSRPAKVERQLQLFTRAFQDLATRCKYWPNFDAETRGAALAGVSSSLERMPGDLLAGLNQAVSAELNRRERGASEGAAPEKPNPDSLTTDCTDNTDNQKNLPKPPPTRKS